jgi:hypothetical protein
MVEVCQICDKFFVYPNIRTYRDGVTICAECARHAAVDLEDPRD